MPLTLIPIYNWIIYSSYSSRASYKSQQYLLNITIFYKIKLYFVRIHSDLKNKRISGASIDKEFLLTLIWKSIHDPLFFKCKRKVMFSYSVEGFFPMSFNYLCDLIDIICQWELDSFTEKHMEIIYLIILIIFRFDLRMMPKLRLKLIELVKLYSSFVKEKLDSPLKSIDHNTLTSLVIKDLFLSYLFRLDLKFTDEMISHVFSEDGIPFWKNFVQYITINHKVIFSQVILFLRLPIFQLVNVVLHHPQYQEIIGNAPKYIKTLLQQISWELSCGYFSRMNYNYYQESYNREPSKLFVEYNLITLEIFGFKLPTSNFISHYSIIFYFY